MDRDRQPAFGVWITGLPASGKSTVAAVLAEQIRGTGREVTVLESDRLRTIFSENPQYDDRERDFFYGSVAFVGRVLVENGISVIFDATANRRDYRNRARTQIARFIEVFVDTPLEVCARRDPKGIYRMAREGKASHVPGLQASYEPPENPDIVIDGEHEAPHDAARRIIGVLKTRGFLQQT
jgi:adenylylsulfate kinase